MPSLIGDLPLKLSGTPQFLVGGGTPALVFRGETERAFVDGKVLAKAAVLPKESISIVGWVRMDRGEPQGGLGGLVCLFQNHFDAERGLPARL